MSSERQSVRPASARRRLLPSSRAPSWPRVISWHFSDDSGSVAGEHDLRETRQTSVPGSPPASSPDMSQTGCCPHEDGVGRPAGRPTSRGTRRALPSPTSLAALGSPVPVERGGMKSIISPGICDSFQLLSSQTPRSPRSAGCGLVGNELAAIGSNQNLTTRLKRRMTSARASEPRCPFRANGLFKPLSESVPGSNRDPQLENLPGRRQYQVAGASKPA